MKFNPKWVAGFLFFVIGLLWSHGNGWWIVGLGLWTAVGVFGESG